MNKQLVESTDYVGTYLQWLKENINERKVSDTVTEITAPFLDRHNDHIQIYVTPSNEENKLVLTDDGYILSDLAMSGIDLSARTRKIHLQTMLNGYGVQLDERTQALFVETHRNQFAQGKHALMQCMLSVNDLYVTGRAGVENVFHQECRDFLEENDIRYVENISVSGKSGLSHNHEFLIPHSRKYPERFIKTVNSLDTNMTNSILFAWTEVHAERRGSLMYTLLNDENHQADDKVIALRNYEIRVVKFSERMKIIPELAG